MTNRYHSMTQPAPVLSDTDRLEVCRPIFERVSVTPNAPKNPNAWADVFNAETADNFPKVYYRTARRWLAVFQGNLTIQNRQGNLTPVYATPEVPEDWIALDIPAPVQRDVFVELQSIRDELQVIVNESMNTIDEANGHIEAIDNVLTVIQSEHRIASLSLNNQSLTARLAIAEDSLANANIEIARQKDQINQERISRSSQG